MITPAQPSSQTGREAARERDLARLIEIMEILRTPVTGCAWDLAQTFETIAPFAIEEAYEVADAVARGDLLDLRDELGDLLLQVVFHARLAQERGIFDVGDVIAAINTKLVRRHPHIFGDAKGLTPDQVKSQWDSIKAQEKAARTAERGLPSAGDLPSALDRVPAGLPPLARARRLQAAAAAVGFDWPQVAPAIAKVREEIDEVEAALLEETSSTKTAEEIGDLLFSVVNVARHAGVDPDKAMTDANAKFTRRFRAVETRLAGESKTATAATLAELDAHWNQVKRDEG